MRVVLDGGHAGPSVLVATEINDPVEPLVPPPRWRQVITPRLLRPLRRCFATTRLRSGLRRVTSLKSLTTRVRVPGV